MKLSLMALVLVTATLSQVALADEAVTTPAQAQVQSEMTIMNGAFVCGARNGRGMRFFATGWNIEAARIRAMEKCRAVSADCIPTGCHR